MKKAILFLIISMVTTVAFSQHRAKNAPAKKHDSTAIQQAAKTDSLKSDLAKDSTGKVKVDSVVVFSQTVFIRMSRQQATIFRTWLRGQTVSSDEFRVFITTPFLDQMESQVIKIPAPKQ